MKNKSLLPILLLAALTLGACNLGGQSQASKESEQPQTSISGSADTSEDTTQYGVAIANKEALQGEWYAGTNRDLDVALTPAANPLAELGKNLTVVSSDPETVKVTGLGLSALKAGSATITVNYHDATDTVQVTILSNSAKAKYGVAHEGTAEDPFTNEDALAVAKSSKYEGEVYYVKGIISSFYNAPGSRTDGMVAYYLTPATSGGEKFEVYKCFKEDGSALTDDDIWVGGEAVAYGAFTVYNGQYETSSAVFVSCTGNKPNPRQTLTKTFAETLALGAALDDGADSYDYIKFQGYVTKKSGNNYFLTATKGEEIVSGKSDAAHGERDIYTNAIELYNAGTVAELVAKLLEGAKVEVTMVVKNYHGTIENGLNLTNDDVTVIEQGQEWAIPTTKATVAEAIAVITALEDGKTTDAVYEITGYITAVTTAWSTQYKNISYTIGDTADAAASAVITVFRSKAAEGTDGSALKAGDKVKVVGNLQKYVKDGAMTPELTSGETTLVEAGADLPVDITDVNAEATVKTIAEIRAYQAADATVLAKVTGVAENKYGDAKYGNFHLVDPETGAEITIYGGYSDATFTKTGAVYATKTKTTAVTADIVGKTVTVYGTVGAYNKVGQLVDALVVVGDAYTGNVAASVAVNEASMGSAELSAASVAYGAEITVNITPASGYQVAKVEVQRASNKQEIEAASGVYKFNAQIKNEVLVTFEEIPAAGVAKATLKYSDTTTTANMTETGNAAKLGLDATIFTVNAGKGEASNLPGLNKACDIRLYSLKSASATGHGSFFTVSIASGYTIKSIKIDFKQNAADAVIYAGDTVVTGTDGAYEINASSFKVENGYKSDGTANNQVQINSIEIVYQEGGTDPQPEIAQPTGAFRGLAKSKAGTFLPVDMVLAADSVTLSANGDAVAVTSYEWDKTEGQISIVTDAAGYGTIVAKLDVEKNVFTITSINGTAALASLDLTYAVQLSGNAQFLDCEGSTAELQAMFLRRKMGSSGWEAANADDKIFSSENGKNGKGLSVKCWADGKIALTLKNDLNIPAKNIKSVGCWIYNPSATAYSTNLYFYPSAGNKDGKMVKTFSLPAGQWTFCECGVAGGSFGDTNTFYNFQFYTENVNTTLVFDNFCIYM